MLSLYLFLVLGFIGSGHCVGMCGPLVMGYTLPQKNSWHSHVLYGLGRSTTYALLGFLAGSFGEILQSLLGFRATLLILAGGVMIYLALGQLKVLPRKLPSIQHYRWYRESVGRLYASKSWYRTYPLGVLLGFIPCGLTAMALSLGITQPIAIATLGMFIFGLGTMPAMVGFGILIQRLKIPKLERYVAMAMLILGCLTLWMGVYTLGWLPPPPQSALLGQLHPTSLPGTDYTQQAPDRHLHHHH
ncbi:sulfite exporter TauE/SafE family protein [Argonema galeatum]|uniref:sulfite exporter TauE/SafE family protein n=1 Tax=Argonema galeatum TaxID=2942762 RepID=UPI00201292F4|nr:sulfite exporter TauE/SafE family protein [Argonema galeatum]MCL1464878.1 sulfite exporter TauE/SafE family protein [Argonema galeatum A003/A1]